MKPEFRVPLDDPIYLFRTSTMMIHCKPLGGPVPEKTWKRDNVDIVDGGRYKILKNGSLQISNVQESDAGKYRCTAVNVLGSAFSEGTAVVLGNIYSMFFFAAKCELENGVDGIVCLIHLKTIK